MNNKLSVLDLEENVVRIGESVRVLVTLKQTGSEKFIDVRKWLKFPNQVDFLPSKKGICLNIEEWQTIIEKLLSTIKESKSIK